MSLLRLIIFALTCALALACTQSPTGRNTIKLFPPGQMSSMGVQAFDQMKSELPVAKASKQNQYVECVARHVVAQLPPGAFDGQWEVVVFDQDQINAFALPGGKIGVYTGILKVAKNQHQLAAIIGHEVGHVIAEHANERMSRSTLVQGGLVLADSAVRAYSPENAPAIMAGLGLGAQVGLQLPFSRTHESEADIIGLELMARAGFNPKEAPALWRNMQKASGARKQPEFLSTHPSPETRIERLEAAQDKVRPLYLKAAVKPRCR